jgi:hypothetical protein
VLGLTATPIRRDGLQPIIMMQCGPIRHRASRSEAASASLAVHTYEVDTDGDLGRSVGVGMAGGMAGGVATGESARSSIDTTLPI